MKAPSFEPPASDKPDLGRAYLRGALVGLLVLAVVAAGLVVSGAKDDLADAVGPSRCLKAMEHHLALAENATAPDVQGAHAAMAEAYASAEFAGSKCRDWSA